MLVRIRAFTRKRFILDTYLIYTDKSINSNRNLEIRFHENLYNRSPFIALERTAEHTDGRGTSQAKKLMFLNLQFQINMDLREMFV